jgi:enoyl-CoA hydratase
MIELELIPPIAVIRIREEERLNALNSETMSELLNTIESIEDRGVRSAIITGSGKSFIAGADIKEMCEMSSKEAESFSSLGHELVKKMHNSGTAYIAAVNGYAFGGGVEVALACDIILASKSAVFAQSESNLGIIPGWGGTRNLPERVGRHRALRLMLTGEQIGADEALRIGLVDMVYESNDELIRSALELGKRIAEKSPLVIKKIKECVYDDIDFTREENNFALCFSTEDQREGMKAFLEKRKPEFRGR